ncbi:hypothetical protein [Halococcus saccharolyticus]|uniref:hypothetical protein n=1 Tax=Halococcus saccharolyticus TaxID=62319 RepID=UPI00137552C4|nr:hypothetical protein [Halococcus saccharolyticus]
MAEDSPGAMMQWRIFNPLTVELTREQIEQVGVIVKSRKPRHRLDGRLYDDA